MAYVCYKACRAFSGGVILSIRFEERSKMFSRKVQFGILLLVVGLLSACVSNTAQAPASRATETVIPSTSAPQVTQAPANTAAVTNTAEPATQNTPAAATVSVSFSKDIVPILDNSCMDCHSGNRIEEGL